MTDETRIGAGDPCPRCSLPLDDYAEAAAPGILYGALRCAACFWSEPAVAAASTPHTRVVADEIQRLRGKLALAEASFKETDAENDRFRAEVAASRARIDELLRSNNEYLEGGRAARRELLVARAVNAIVTRQMVTLMEALEFYADEEHYDASIADASPPESIVFNDHGTTAEQALQDVMGESRPARGLCGAVVNAGEPACMLFVGHDGPHGWLTKA